MELYRFRAFSLSTRAGTFHRIGNISSHPLQKRDRPFTNAPFKANETKDRIRIGEKNR